MNSMCDDDDRPALSYFNLAFAYWQSAIALREKQVRAPYSDNPILFLYLHSTELYLKAYLRLHEYTAKKLQYEYRHNIPLLSQEAQSIGFKLSQHDLKVLSLIEGMDIFDVRYIRTGFPRRPTCDVLDRTCKNFNRRVCTEMRKHGIKVPPHIKRPLATFTGIQRVLHRGVTEYK